MFLNKYKSFECLRYTLLLGAGDKKDEVATAARNALYSAIRRANNQVMGFNQDLRFFSLFYSIYSVCDFKCLKFKIADLDVTC